MKENFGLYLILTDPIAGYGPCAQAAVDCNVRYLQLRMKDAPQDAMLETARTLREITLGTQTRFIVNDNLAVAIESDADGIHLGQNDQPLAEARKIWDTPGKIFGFSTHGEEQAARALALEPDYIGVGPIFPTPTKIQHDPALGIAEVGRIMKASPLTTVAIGGIDTGNLAQLLEGGSNNFCVVRAVNNSADPAAAIRNLLKIWERHSF